MEEHNADRNDAGVPRRAIFGHVLILASAAALVLELRSRGMRVEVEVPISIAYAGSTIAEGFRVDLVVNEEVMVEVKAIAQLLPIHHAQAMTYLKLSKRRVALLINFNVVHLKDGITRFVV